MFFVRVCEVLLAKNQRTSTNGKSKKFDDETDYFEKKMLKSFKKNLH